jgi:hypothetical protein
LELALHPANKTPKEFKEDKANVYNIPNVRSEIVNPCPNGIIPHYF